MIDATEIEALEGLEAVRRRPALYLGALDDPLLATRLLLEAFCIARDEAVSGACTRVTIELRENRRAGKPTTPFERHEATERHGTSLGPALAPQPAG